MNTSKKQILTFLGLTFALSAIFYAWIIAAVQGGRQAPAMATFLLMWCPGIAALLTKLISERSLKSLGWRLGRFGWLGLAYLLPLAYALVPYAVAWMSGLAGFTTANLPGNQPLPVYLAVTPTLIFLVGGLPAALGEEIGWRGLLLPELAKTNSLARAALISGLIWTAWHMPILLFGGYNAGAPAWYGAACFTLLATGISFPMAWLTMKSGSLWPAAVLHASHNIFIQAIFDVLTRPTAVSPYITTEFGAGLTITAVITALIFWQRMKEKRI